jgi:hypothetical protein
VWHGPGEDWPRHSKPYWRASLSYAKQNGWWLCAFEGHSFGRVQCQREGDDVCDLLILRTGQDGETFALELRDLVDSCPHDSAQADSLGPEEITARVREARRLLEGAERLVEAAKKLMEAGDLDQRAQELLAIADGQAAQAQDALMWEALSMERAGGELREDAAALAAWEGVPLEPGQLLSDADARLDRVESELGSVPPADTRSAQLLERAAGLRAQIGTLRERLA